MATACGVGSPGVEPHPGIARALLVVRECSSACTWRSHTAMPGKLHVETDKLHAVFRFDMKRNKVLSIGLLIRCIYLYDFNN